ncbi:MAG: glycosyltransferase [Anaerolineales bacterium]|nr:glycosyltransferase [Anaerolineales bacterium]
MISRFSGRLGIQQRVLPLYRLPFFDSLGAACDGGLSLFAGLPRPEESISVTDQLRFTHYVLAKNIHIFRGPLYLCWQGGLIQWLDDWLPDALIVEANPRYLSTPAAVHWMKARGRPVLGWGLGAPPLAGPLACLRRPARIRFLSRFDALITYSQRGAQEYAALGFPADKIFIAPNAAAPRPLSPPPSRPSTFNPSGRTSGRGLRPVVLFVGRLQARKRLDLLLQACAALPTALQPRLVIVGDGAERAALESLAEQIYPPAEFVAALHGAALAPYFTAADLFVLPGTGGLAVQEAMSYGLPVIMGQGDGTNDDLVRPENGWQIPPDDFPALTETLRLALSDAARLRRMGAESYRIVSEEINIERMVGVFVEALNSVRP